MFLMPRHRARQRAGRQPAHGPGGWGTGAGSEPERSGKASVNLLHGPRAHRPEVTSDLVLP